MKKISIIICLLGIALLYSCGRSAEDVREMSKDKEDSIAPATTEEKGMSAAPTDAPASAQTAPAADDADKANKTSSPVKKTSQQTEQRSFYDSVYVVVNANRKLIKTANLEFKVADVEKATLKIENLVYRYGGFTLKSEIKTTTEQSNTVRINNDSVLEVGVNNIENNMTIRVPQFLLDTLLLKMASLWIELDERSVNAEDVTIDYLANDLRAKMHQKTAGNINRAAQNGGRLDDVVEAERAANQFLETSIQKQIDNMSLQDRVDYATITLRFYQDEVLYKRTIASYKIEEYEEGFGSQFVDALAFGWEIILGFILFIARGWSVILIMVVSFLVVYYFIRYMIRRAKRKSA